MWVMRPRSIGSKVRKFQPLDMLMHFSTPAVNLGFVPIQNKLSNKSHRPLWNLLYEIKILDNALDMYFFL